MEGLREKRRPCGSTAKTRQNAVKVTDTITAFLQTPPEPTRPVLRKQSQAATTALSSLPANEPVLSLGPPGTPQALRQVTSWVREVVLPFSGVLRSSGKNSPRADAILTASKAVSQVGGRLRPAINDV